MKYLSKITPHILASTLIFGGVFVLSLFHFGDVSAQATGGFSAFRVPFECNKPGVECGWGEFVALGNEIIKFCIYLAVIGATLAFVVAGFKMMMNAGNSGEISAAKKIMWTATKGLVFALSAWLIVDFILDNLGVGSDFRTIIQ